MTTVYGVTRYGGKLQIERQLEKLKDFPQEHKFEASLYLVQKTFDCLHQKFSATKEIQVRLHHLEILKKSLLDLYFVKRIHPNFRINVL